MLRLSLDFTPFRGLSFGHRDRPGVELHALFA